MTIAFLAGIAKNQGAGQSDRAIPTKDANYDSGKLTEMARDAPIGVTKHDRAVIVVVAAEGHSCSTPMPIGLFPVPKSATGAKRPVNVAAQ